MADREAMAHLLRRATFGPTAQEVDGAERAGPVATVERLLTGADAGAARTPAPVPAADPYTGLPAKPTREQKQAAQQRRNEQIRALSTWWLQRMAGAERQLAEKMVFFWHGHWATSVQKVKSAALMQRQLDTFRRLGLGGFAALAREMVADPALILWLDGQRNTAKAPNENLARELMELFTLGIGAYTEDDVKAGARALTGWTVDRATGRAELDPKRHDGGAKTILGRTGDFTAASYADLLAGQEASALFVARRLWFRFASTEPMPEEVGRRLVAAGGPGHDVGATVRALFADPAFGATRGLLVKQPVEWFVGALRQLDIRPPSPEEAQAKQLLAGLGRLDQVPLRPPSVGGWPAGQSWLTTSSLRARLQLAQDLSRQAGETAVTQLMDAPKATRLDALARLLVVDSWTPRTRAALTPTVDEPRKLIALGLITPEYTVH